MTAAQLIPLLFTGALAMLVLAVGLDARLSDLLYLPRHPRKFGIAFLVVAILPPLIALAAVSILPLGPVSRVGVLLMAICPVPPLVPGKTLKIGGTKEYVYSLYLMFALLSVVIVPAGVWVLDHIYGRSAFVSPLTIATMVGKTVLAPMIVGLVIQATWPRFGSAASVWVRRFAMVLVVIAAVPLIIHSWPAIYDLIGDGTVVAIFVITALVIAAGHFLGGEAAGERTALAASAATRHPGLALMVAHGASAQPTVGAAIMLYLLTSLVGVTIYQIILKRTAARSPSASSSA